MSINENTIPHIEMDAIRTDMRSPEIPPPAFATEPAQAPGVSAGPGPAYEESAASSSSASSLSAPMSQAIHENIVMPQIQQLQQQLEPFINQWVHQISPCWPHLTIMGVIGFLISLFLGIQKIIIAIQENPEHPQLLAEYIKDICVNVTNSLVT